MRRRWCDVLCRQPHPGQPGLKSGTEIGERAATADAVATVVHGDFEWDEAKATSNIAKHGISFDEATLAMKDPFSQDFDDALHPANLITLAALAIWA